MKLAKANSGNRINIIEQINVRDASNGRQYFKKTGIVINENQYTGERFLDNHRADTREAYDGRYDNLEEIVFGRNNCFLIGLKRNQIAPATIVTGEDGNEYQVFYSNDELELIH